MQGDVRGSQGTENRVSGTRKDASREKFTIVGASVHCRSVCSATQKSFGVAWVTQRDVTKCPSSASVNTLFVVRPEINRGRYDTGVEFRVSTMIVLKPAAAAGVCLGAFGTSIRRCRRQRVSVDAHVGRRDGCRRGKSLSSSRSLTSRRMLPRIASTRSLSVDGFVDGEFCRRGVSRRGRGYGGVWHGDANEQDRGWRHPREKVQRWEWRVMLSSETRASGKLGTLSSNLEK